ncbi:MAG: hypothetical protein ACI9OJ_003962 [Myxococcota bacterium]|jgi:hypothetical protein
MVIEHPTADHDATLCLPLPDGAFLLEREARFGAADVTTARAERARISWRAPPKSWAYRATVSERSSADWAYATTESGGRPFRGWAAARRAWSELEAAQRRPRRTCRPGY